MYKAIGMIEFTSISKGIYVADQMLKAAEVEAVATVPVCPGKYIAIVQGDVAAVQDSIETGIRLAEDFLVDSLVIPNIHPSIFPAITGSTEVDKINALGILESFSLACTIKAADAALKAAEISALDLRLGTGIGGKAYFTFTGDVAAVEAAMDAGKTLAVEEGLLVNAEVIPSPTECLWQSLF